MSLFNQFTISQLIIEIIWAIVLSGLLRAAMWLFDAVPKDERLYWVIVPLGVLAVLVVIGALAKSVPNRPVLTGHIDQINTHPHHEKRDSSSMLLIVSIRNAGSPTVLESWHVRVTNDQGLSLDGANQYIPETVTLEGPSGTITYHGKDGIYNKAINAPLQYGGMIRGVLWVTFDKVDVSTLRQQGNKVHVFYTDVFGKEHKTVQDMSGLHAPIAYFPGLGKPMEKPEGE